MIATTAEWFKEKGRHEIYAGNRPMTLPDAKTTLKLRHLENGEIELPLINGNGNGNGTSNDGDDCGPSCGCSSGSLEDRVRQILRAPEPELGEVEA